MIGEINFLQLLWFLLISLLFMIFYFTEDLNYGVGMATKFLVGNDQEKHLMMEAIGPHWDENEAWLITAGGAMLASFSDWHTSLFNSYYILLFFTLSALIVGGVSFEFSAHAEAEHGFGIWTDALLWGSLLTPSLLTITFGSLVRGMPIDTQGNMNLSFWNIINPLSIVASIAGVPLCLIRGINFLRLRIDDPELNKRAASLSEKFYLITCLGEVVFALLVFLQTDFSKLRPVSSTVAILIIITLTVWSDISLTKDKQIAIFVTSGLTLVAVVGFLLDGLFPRVLIATDSAYPLLIKTAANSKLTLEVVTVVALILLSITLVYIIWLYVVFRRRIKVNQNA